MIATDIQIRFSDFDAFRHINNAVYSSWYEIGRVDFMQQTLGADHVDTLERIPFILARVEIDLIAPVDYGMKAQVQTKVSRIGSKSWDFSAQICDPGSGRVYSIAKTVQVCYDYKQAKSVEVRQFPWLLHALEKHQDEAFSR